MFWILTFHYLLLREFRGLSSITFLNPELNVETKIFTESSFLLLFGTDEFLPQEFNRSLQTSRRYEAARPSLEPSVK